MKFLDGFETSQKSAIILETVIRMAKWMNLRVVAEGVEDRKEWDYLKSMECDLVQGFYFYRPMPEEDFLQLLDQKEENAIPVHQDEFADKEQNVIAGLHRAVQPDSIDLESDLALIAVVGRGMRRNRGTAARIFAALAHSHVNVKMIDQGSSELNIIIGVENRDFETAIRSIYDIFVLAQV